MQFFGQKIDSLNLWIVENKLKIISRLSFPKILVKFKIYLGMIEWLYDYVIYYVAIAKLLQNRKILILTNSFKDGQKKKNFVMKIKF